MPFSMRPEALQDSGSGQSDGLRAGQSRGFSRYSSLESAARRRRKFHADGAVFASREFFGAAIGFREVTADFDAGDFQRRGSGIAQRNTCRGERGGRRSDSRGAGGQRCISKGAGKGRARSLQQHGY